MIVLISLVPDHRTKPALCVEQSEDFSCYHVQAIAVDGSILSITVFQTLSAALREVASRLDEIERQFPGTKWEAER